MPKRPFFITLTLIVTILSISFTLYADSQAGQRAYLPVVIHSQPTPTPGPVNGTPLVKINFQPANVALPVGYQLDSGAPFSNRGNGFSYGWNSDTSATTRDRDSANAPDQRYDTLIQLQKPENPDAVWEMAVPNGVYELLLVAGDPAHADSVYHFTAEGATVLQATPSEGNWFKTAVFQTHVTDGRLTIRSGQTAQNNKLAFVEINTVSLDPATPTPTPQPGTMTEFRGLWVSRFDWTGSSSGNPGKVDQIVADAAYAGFNAIFFQVRGEADAFYTPGLEPWSRRLTGTLGQNPGWDPLARMIEQAHAHNIQVHAYLNVYPVWTGCDTPPSNTTPQHLYYKLLDAHGSTNGKNNGLQWYSNGNVACSSYQRATPASVYHDEHILAVARDLVTRYDVDGIHLDHIRYDSGSASCDPVSLAAFGGSCFSSGYADWQRRQVNGTVNKFYEQIVPLKQGLWLSAAVWPIYIDYWGWGGQEGYYDYYQDSKAWVKGGYIDSISPMIYPSSFDCNSEGFWTQSRWRTLVENFQGDSNGRFVIPGIGAGYCTFAEIEARINAARSLGTAGHAIFSYSGLASHGYFDDLRNGPYKQTAVPPTITWHP